MGPTGSRSVHPTETDPRGASFASGDELFDQLIARRRRLLLLLGIPALACFAAYIGLLLWGQSVLSVAVGNLNVGWVFTLVALAVAPVVCSLYARWSTTHLDPLREAVAANRSRSEIRDGSPR